MTDILYQAPGLWIFSMLNSTKHGTDHAHKWLNANYCWHSNICKHDQNANNCWHFNINKQDQFKNHWHFNNYKHDEYYIWEIEGKKSRFSAYYIVWAVVISCSVELCIEKAFNLGVWTLKKNSGTGKNGHLCVRSDTEARLQASFIICRADVQPYLSIR